MVVPMEIQLSFIQTVQNICKYVRDSLHRRGSFYIKSKQQNGKIEENERIGLLGGSPSALFANFWSPSALASFEAQRRKVCRYNETLDILKYNCFNV